MPRKTKTIDELTDEYRARLIRQSTNPPPAQVDRAERLLRALQRTEVSLDRSEHRRARLLLRAAMIRVDQGDYAALYGLAAELAALARTKVLGVQEAHPIPASTRPPPLLPPAPPRDVEEDARRFEERVPVTAPRRDPSG